MGVFCQNFYKRMGGRIRNSVNAGILRQKEWGLILKFYKRMYFAQKEWGFSVKISIKGWGGVTLEIL